MIVVGALSHKYILNKLTIAYKKQVYYNIFYMIHRIFLFKFKVYLLILKFSLPFYL